MRLVRVVSINREAVSKHQRSRPARGKSRAPSAAAELGAAHPARTVARLPPPLRLGAHNKARRGVAARARHGPGAVYSANLHVIRRPWRVRRWSPARVRRGPCAWGRGREPTAFIGNGSGGGDLVPEDDAVAALGQLPEENSPPRRLLACRSSSMRATGVILL